MKLKLKNRINQNLLYLGYLRKSSARKKRQQLSTSVLTISFLQTSWEKSTGPRPTVLESGSERWESSCQKTTKSKARMRKK